MRFLDIRIAAAIALVWTLAGPAAGQTLADLRSEVAALNGLISELRGQLVATGGEGTTVPGLAAPALQRLDALEAELRRLTNRVDVLSNDVSRIVDDATNRVGDIEFRLTELEGGDVGALGATEPLGGGVTTPATAPPPEAGGTPELALSEQADFEAARAAVQAGEHARGADLLARFVETYPGGPLTAEAEFWRGEALSGQGDWNGAARSYLDAFSGAPEGDVAPRALLRLGISLGRLGKGTEACLTLAEVEARYPGSEAAGQVPAERQSLGCS